MCVGMQSRLIVGAVSVGVGIRVYCTSQCRWVVSGRHLVYYKWNMSVFTEASRHHLAGEEHNEGLIRSRGYILHCFETRWVEVPTLFLVRHRHHRVRHRHANDRPPRGGGDRDHLAHTLINKTSMWFTKWIRYK